MARKSNTLTLPQFTNVARGTTLRQVETGLVYRLEERCGPKMVLVRVSPALNGAPLVRVLAAKERSAWAIEERAY